MNTKNKRSKGKSAKSNAPRASTTVVVTQQQPRSRPRRPTPQFDFARDSYLATLVDPFGVHGVRVPDEITTPSGCLTLRRRFTIRSIQDGSTGKYAACVAYSPIIESSIKASASYNSTTGSITFGAVSTFADATAAKALMRGYRVVSAGLAIMQTNAMSQNQGRNLCAYFTGNDTVVPFVGSALTDEDVLNGEISEDSPVNSQTICCIKWSPSDGTNFAYHRPNASNTGSVTDAGYFNPGTLVWYADGLSSTSSFEVTVILNVEFLPAKNTFSFCPLLPSLYHVGAMQRALNSPLVTRTFGTTAPENVMISENSNSLGISSFIGQMASNFGNGATDVIGQAARRLGQSLAMAGITAVARRVTQPPLGAGLAGHPLPLQY